MCLLFHVYRTIPDHACPSGAFLLYHSLMKMFVCLIMIYVCRVSFLTLVSSYSDLHPGNILITEEGMCSAWSKQF